MKQILSDAKENSYAIGQYNINTLLWMTPILEASEEKQAPVIIATSDRMVDALGGFSTVAATLNELLKELSITVPVVLHLDHASCAERCKKAIDAGYSSVMIDGSSLPIDENIALTKRVTNYAELFGVSVEAEVGSVGGVEDGQYGEVKYADISDCIRITKEAKIDALAAALGSVHGPYKGEPKLGFTEMESISKAIEIPLVLHGGSGIPINQIRKAIELGHAKINVNTECAQAWTNSIRNYFKKEENNKEYMPNSFLKPAYESIKKVVKQKIVDFETGEKAKLYNELS